jgi:hypothetical protein
MDRRIAPRVRVPLLCNKHLEGTPYLAEVMDLSEDGLLLRTTIEPERQPEHFTLEVGVPGNPQRLWLWARSVRRLGAMQAVRLVGVELFDRAVLAQLVRWHLVPA